MTVSVTCERRCCEPLVGSLRNHDGNVTGTSLKKIICKQHNINGSARVLQFLVHFFVVLYKTTTLSDQIFALSEEREYRGLIFGICISTEVIAVLRI